MKRGFVKRMLATVTAAAVIATSAMAFPTEAQAASKKVKSISVSGVVKKTMVINKGVKRTLKVYNGSTKKRMTNSQFTFKTSAPKVVSASQKGVLKAKRYGKSKITVIYKKDKKVKQTFTVIVPKKSQYVKSVKLNKTKVTLNSKTKTFKLKATVSPTKAATEIVKWTSSNTKVAKVDDNGKVTAVGPGTAKITAKTICQSKKATCTVTVTKATKVALNSKTGTIGEGGTVGLKATVKPARYFGKVTWKSSNTKVAKVSSTGRVTGISAGTAIITARATGGAKATYKLTVKKSTVALDKTTASLNAGAAVTLKATINPSNTTAKVASWTSSNVKVAKVDANGKVTAVAAGTANITVKLTNGNSATCKVTVKKVDTNVPATAVVVKADKATIKANETAKITATMTPANTTDKVELSLSAADAKFATLKDGVLSANTIITDSKTVTVTAKTTSGKTSTVKVTIVGTADALVGSKAEGYTVTLDKKAENYTVTKDSKSYAVSPAEVLEDKALIKKIGNIVDVEAPAKGLFDAISNNNFNESLILGSNASVKVVKDGENVKNVTITSQGSTVTVKVELVSGTALKVTRDGKEVEISNIAATKNANDYTYTAKVATSSNTINVKTVIAKDGSKIVMTDEDAGSAVIASYEETAEAYTAKVSAGYYGRIINALDSNDKLADVTVVNDYNVVK